MRGARSFPVFVRERKGGGKKNIDVLVRQGYYILFSQKGDSFQVLEEVLKLGEKQTGNRSLVLITFAQVLQSIRGDVSGFQIKNLCGGSLLNGVFGTTKETSKGVLLIKPEGVPRTVEGLYQIGPGFERKHRRKIEVERKS